MEKVGGEFEVICARSGEAELMFSTPDEAVRAWGDLFFPIDSVGGGPKIGGAADKKAGARPDD